MVHVPLRMQTDPICTIGSGEAEETRKMNVMRCTTRRGIGAASGRSEKGENR